MTTIVRGRMRDGAWVDQEFIYKPPAEVFGAANDHYGTRLLFDRAGHLFYSIGDRGQQDDAQSLAARPARSTASWTTAASRGQPLRGARGRAGHDLELRQPQPAGARVPPGDGRALGVRARPARRRRAQPDRARAATTAGRSSPTASTTTARRSATRPSRKAWRARSSSGRRRSPCAGSRSTPATASRAGRTTSSLGGLVGQQLRRLVIEGAQGGAPGGPVPQARPRARGRERPRRLPVRRAQHAREGSCGWSVARFDRQGARALARVTSEYRLSPRPRMSGRGCRFLL